jgi:hypothetical protein
METIFFKWTKHGRNSHIFNVLLVFVIIFLFFCFQYFSLLITCFVDWSVVFWICLTYVFVWFVCLGNFRHEPNEDSLQYLKYEIWPKIHAQLPSKHININMNKRDANGNRMRTWTRHNWAEKLFICFFLIVFHVFVCFD